MFVFLLLKWMPKKSFFSALLMPYAKPKPTQIRSCGKLCMAVHHIPVLTSVSFDGTWQKRGFTSLYGVGMRTDVLTGLIIDYHVLSKYFHACEVNTKRIPPAELLVWKTAHARDCCINHNQSSKPWRKRQRKFCGGHSIIKYNMWYIGMLSDGNSSPHKAVCEFKLYGADVEIRKLDYVNHAHKHMETAH